MFESIKYIFILFFFLSAGYLSFTYDDFGVAYIKLGNKPMQVLVAENRYQQYKGLGGKEELKKHDGMLFKYFPARKAGIVMRDMKFPIDIIWIKDNQVVGITREAKPQPDASEEELKVYKPDRPVNYVLEVPAGKVDKYGIEVSSTMRILE
jgi:uncharacterized membrane protein (UPF0127 family)